MRLPAPSLVVAMDGLFAVIASKIEAGSRLPYDLQNLFHDVVLQVPIPPLLQGSFSEMYGYKQDGKA